MNFSTVVGRGWVVCIFENKHFSNFNEQFLRGIFFPNENLKSMKGYYGFNIVHHNTICVITIFPYQVCFFMVLSGLLYTMQASRWQSCHTDQTKLTLCPAMYFVILNMDKMFLNSLNFFQNVP